jgi:DNA-binding YbaB/EbfC family protein
MNPFGNPQKMMKQLQQAQEKMQREIAALQVEATSGGGMVKVVMDGQKAVRGLTIDPEVVSKDDVEMLQDLVRPRRGHEDPRPDLRPPMSSPGRP